MSIPFEGTEVDPLHQRSRPGMMWSLANTSEALPGILTPLLWTFWQPRINLAIRAAYHDLGVFTRSERSPAPDPLDNFGAVFYGRYTASVELMGKLADRMPGTSRAQVQAAILGLVQEEASNQNTRARYPYIAIKLPTTLLSLPHRVKSLRKSVDKWWSLSAWESSPWASRQAQVRVSEAADWFERVLRVHTDVTYLAQLAFARLTNICNAVGIDDPDTLIVGSRPLEEAVMLEDLWLLSRRRMPQEVFIRRHGFHGPREGAIDAPSWREDPSLLNGFLRSLGESKENEPSAMFAQRAQVSRRARHELLKILPSKNRASARMLLRVSSRLMPLREVGKAAFLQTLDVLRAAAREEGTRLASAGILESPDDVFQLTLDEFLSSTHDPDIRERIEVRKERRAYYESIELPTSWIGDPIPVPIASAREKGSGDPDRRTGMACSAGSVVGTARVIVDPDRDQFEPGEILICRSTDPGWSPLLYLASAVVTELGGLMSHGAIIARELGLPAVLGVQGVASWIRTGDVIRVDGIAGTIERIS